MDRPNDIVRLGRQEAEELVLAIDRIRLCAPDAAPYHPNPGEHGERARVIEGEPRWGLPRLGVGILAERRPWYHAPGAIVPAALASTSAALRRYSSALVSMATLDGATLRHATRVHAPRSIYKFAWAHGDAFSNRILP
jgi:hypothetical protein